MTENDKFERSLPRYWSKAHRLACANSSIPAIVDEITSGARLTLGREASCRAICQLADLLQQLKPAETAPPLEERSQRARSFLFLTLGVIAAERVGADALLMCENGVGAINLPIDGTQLGTSNARAAHPGTLLGFNRLLASLVGDSVRVRNPFWDITKGEACRHDNLRQLGHAITVSRPSTPLRGKSLHPLQAMEWQFLRLRRALNARDPWSSMALATPTSGSDSLAANTSPRPLLREETNHARSTAAHRSASSRFSFSGRASSTESHARGGG